MTSTDPDFYSYYMLLPSSIWQPMIQSMDLRRLCTIILEKTINDPDKYQNGLTKLFFRAGMLAALESLRSDRLNAMVTVVQKNMRRRMAVKKYQELRHSTIKIQTWWRGILAKRLVEHIRREVAAIRLQTAIRRFTERTIFLATRRSITFLQSRKLISWVTDKLFTFFRCARGASAATFQRSEERQCRNATAESPSWRVCCQGLITSVAANHHSAALLVVLSVPMSSMLSTFNHVFADAWPADNSRH